MPYIYSDSWITPKDDENLYRYFTEEKFISLLTTKALYFNEITNFRKDDPNEGLIPYHNRKGIGKEYLAIGFRGINLRVEHSITKKYQIVKFLQKLTVANCWNMGYDENKRMWNAYAKDERGILVKSDIRRLKEAFTYNVLGVYFGKIQYVDHRIYVHNNPNPVSYSFLKDQKLFEWEEELRLMVFDIHNENSEVMQNVLKIHNIKDFFHIDLDNLAGVDHLFVKCDLRTMIKEIIVSPWANESYVKDIKANLLSLDIDVPVKKSKFIGIKGDDGILMDL